MTSFSFLSLLLRYIIIYIYHNNQPIIISLISHFSFIRCIYNPPLIHFFHTTLQFIEKICSHLSSILKRGKSKSKRQTYALELYSSIVDGVRVEMSFLHPPLFVVGDLISQISQEQELKGF